MMMKMLSLPASMQQELAARALRACMAAEAAMASLRAECKPLQTASPQRVLALNTKNMGNAHRSLQLQIEACESFSLSATTAFKQLCDVIFCADSGRSVILEHNSMLHQNIHYSKSSKAQPSDLAASIDGELPDRGAWKSKTNAADESIATSKDNGEGISVNATTTQAHSAGVPVTEAQDTILWGPETGAACTRFPSPEADIKATSREEIVQRGSIEEAEWNRQLDSQLVQDREDASESGNHILTSKPDEDSDASDLDVDMRYEISSLREHLNVSSSSSENQVDDGFQLHKTTNCQSITADIESLTSTVERAGNAPQIQQRTTSEISEFNTSLRNSDHEHHASQTIEIHLNESTKTFALAEVPEASCQQIMEVESRAYVSDAHSGVSSHTATGSPPSASSSSNEVPERCNPYGAIELQPVTPSFSTPVQASWTMAEVTCTQIPSSSASRFSWSCETTRSIDTPSTTQPVSFLEHNPMVSCASGERWDPSKSSSELPLYPAHSQSSKPFGMIPDPLSIAGKAFHQEYKPAELSFESQEVTGCKLQPILKRENGHSPSSPSSADRIYCLEPNVPLTPSPYTLKMRSMFSRANVAAGKTNSSHSVPAPLQCSYGHSDGNLFSMATAVSLSSGYRQPSISSGFPCGSSAYVSVMEKQALQIVAETPQVTQFSVSPKDSSISTSSLSWESPTSSNTSGSDGSGREGSLDTYRRKLENLQEQFPRAHGSFRGETQTSWGTSRVGALLSNCPVGNSSLQNACKIPWQTSHMSTTTTEVERYVGASYSSGSTFDAKNMSAQGRPIGGGGSHIQGNVSDHSVGHGSKGSLEFDSRYDGILLGSKISESQVSEAGLRSTTNRESLDVTSIELNKDSDQNTQSRPEPTSWRWNDDQSDEETGTPVPVSSKDMTSNSGIMLGNAGGCARGETTMRLAQVSDSEEDDDDSSSTEREWNNILLSMQQRGKPKAQ